MDSFKQFSSGNSTLDDLHWNSTLDDLHWEALQEANISSVTAIKQSNNAIKFGREAISTKSVEDKIDALARQNGAIAGLVLMSIAVSGNKSFSSSLSKNLSIRKL